MEMSTISSIPTAQPNKRSLKGNGLQGDVPAGVKDPLHYGLARRLSSVRCSLDLPATTVSARAGLGSTVAGAVEDGKHLPRIDTIERLACALGVPASWLAFGEQAGQPFRKRRPSPVLPPAAPEPVPEGLPFEGLHAGMAERLRSTREALGMSLRELSGPAQVSFEQIRKCEAGLTIARVDTCERLALALDVAPGWLAYGVGQGPARN